MTLAEPRLTSVLTDPLSAAKASGRPIVLYVSNDVPVELIYACGCFPLQLPTAPRADYGRADIYLEPNFEPMVRAALEQLLQGELNAASLLVLPRSIDAWQRLYYYLCELSRSFGEQMPEPFLYDLQKLPNESSAQYNTQSTLLFAEKLAELAGKPLELAALSSSIALYNRIRAELRHYLQRRYERPVRLAGADALDLFTAAQRQDPVVVEATLRYLNTVPEPEPEDAAAAPALAKSIPTILIGSAHDSPVLHHAIARAGGQVVADFHSRGDWSFGPPILEGDDPMNALTEHYHRHSLSTRSYPLPLSALLELAATSGAEAAVFFYYNEEEGLTWDQPAQVAALESQGIRCLLLTRQSYPPSAEVATPLRAFFSSEAQR
jgi:benzoyl-CoA reductase/2-hydroxyglutaryl-CoA dehydratase subunit BcrC/BadD/HgdB